MSKITGIHHLALSTSDLKGQIEFFSDVLGMPLTGLYWMHGAPEARHCFFRLNDESSMSLVFMPQNANIEPTIGQSHPGHGGGASAPGTLQHVSFNVETQADLMAMRDRIRSKGYPVFGPIHHGLCSSIYFYGLENIVLEVASSEGSPHPLDSEGTWIDPEVAELTGISQAELARFMNPDTYANQGGPVPQPAFNSKVPHFAMPGQAYEEMLGTPDDILTAQASVIEPPRQLANS